MSRYNHLARDDNSRGVKLKDGCFAFCHINLGSDERDRRKFISEEHKRCHYVWRNTLQKKDIKFLLIEFNKPFKFLWKLVTEWFQQEIQFTSEFESAWSIIPKQLYTCLRLREYCWMSIKVYLEIVYGQLYRYCKKLDNTLRVNSPPVANWVLDRHWLMITALSPWNSPCLCVPLILHH